MQGKAAAAVILTIILSFSCLMVFQKNRIKAGIKILLSQLSNSAWEYGDDYGCKYRLATPNNLNTADSSKKYPLVIYLHGASERGGDNRIQIYDIAHLGAGRKNKAKEFQVKYPSFVYAPQCPENETWNDPKVLDALTKSIIRLKNEYPIDPDRLYLIGYSMGGSGSYALAEHYYKTTRHNIAAIIRLAGQSSFEQHTHEIVSKSAVWLHVGLKDVPMRIQAAETAFRKLTELHPGAIESRSEITIENHPGTTRTLSLYDTEIAKLSEYTSDGHGISDFPFSDPQLLDWLFAVRSGSRQMDRD